jgi:LacI family repressor for deo operon, udp, cdd, tsx, nupC, and nupG
MTMMNEIELMAYRRQWHPARWPNQISSPQKTRVHVIERLGHATIAASRTIRSRKIIVTVPDISNPFFSCVIQGGEEAAQEMGYPVCLGDTCNQEAHEEHHAPIVNPANSILRSGYRAPISTMPRRPGPRSTRYTIWATGTWR